jgi:hypothetical protein
MEHITPNSFLSFMKLVCDIIGSVIHNSILHCCSWRNKGVHNDCQYDWMRYGIPHTGRNHVSFPSLLCSFTSYLSQGVFVQDFPFFSGMSFDAIINSFLSLFMSFVSLGVNMIDLIGPSLTLQHDSSFGATEFGSPLLLYLSRLDPMNREAKFVLKKGTYLHC